MKKSQKNGYTYEKKMSKQREACHIGGSGKPDYKKGNILGEVKATKRPVDTSMIQKLLKKGIREIESKNGYTAPAKQLAKKRLISLRSRGKRIS